MFPVDVDWLTPAGSEPKLEAPTGSPVTAVVVVVFSGGGWPEASAGIVETLGRDAD